MKRARVFIADDHEITRLGIQSVLMRDPAFKICGEAPDGKTALEQIRTLKPDLAILDVGLPHFDGVEVARQTLRQRPDLSVIIFTEIESERSMRNALEFGVRGFVLKSDPICDLLTAAHAVLRGNTFLSHKLEHILLTKEKAPYGRYRLTRKEREILQLIAEGKAIKEMARLLSVSVKTVETHRTRIMKKLDTHSTPMLILYALRNEIVHVPDIVPVLTSAELGTDTSLSPRNSAMAFRDTVEGDTLMLEAGA